MNGLLWLRLGNLIALPLQGRALKDGNSAFVDGNWNAYPDQWNALLSKPKFYSLAAIIAVGYRINSERAMQFRTWATKVLDTFTKQGYVLDKSRLINGQIFDEDYFEHLIAEIQEIRASERRFYQKITDIYATAVDYDKNSQVTREFYATVQNKMHYAVHGNTAAEVIVARADHNKEHMGLKSWKNAPDGKIVKTDVSIAKNYLEKEELAELNEIVTMYLDYATRQARRHIPMTMDECKALVDEVMQLETEAEVKALLEERARS